MTDNADYMRIDRGSSVLMVSFGGLHEGFNFTHLAERSGYDGLFFRDRKCDWYVSGIDGVSPDLEGVCDFIRRVMDEDPDRRVIFIGQSSGGYAALRYALELEPDACLAFAPQTRPVDDRATAPGRYPEAVVSRPNPGIDDLGRLYRERQPSFRVEVHVCESEIDNPPEAYLWNDWSHIRGLDGVASVRIVRHPCSYHPVAYHLTGTRQLDDIVSSLLP